MPYPALVEQRHAALSTPFGEQYATKLFGAEALADLPRITHGSLEGRARALLHWERCIAAGWSARRGVMLPPGLVWAYVAQSERSPEEEAMVGWWLGRRQPLSGPALLLTEAARREAAEAAAMAQQDLFGGLARLSPHDVRSLPLRGPLHGRRTPKG